MFRISGEENYFYRVSSIKKGTTSKGGQYTFISISNKPRNSNEFENGQVQMWQDVEIKKGDYVAIFEPKSIGYYNDTVGFKTYAGVKIEAGHIKIKEAQEETKEQNKEPQTNSTTPNMVGNNTNNQNQPINTPLQPQTNLRPIDDDTLPF